MKIVVLDGYTENPGDISWEPLNALGEVTVYDRTSYEESELIAERLKDAQIAVVNKTPVSRATIDRCPQLEAIAVRDREMATQESDPESPMLKAWSLSLAHVLRKSRCAPNTRAVFRRLVTEGTSADDVAAEFNITANNVYQIKNRFLRAVKKDLAAVMATLPPGSRTVEDLCEALERRED